MKKFNVIWVVLIATISVSGSLYAQEANKPGQKVKTKSNIKNDLVCVVKISSTDQGADIVFNQEIVSPRDSASGLSTGKRQHKPFRVSVSSTDNTIMEVTSPRDVATGQPTGKRSAGNPIGGIVVKGGKNPGGNQFNKIVVEDGEFSLPQDCPDGEYTMVLSWSWGASNSGSLKRGTASFSLTIENGRCGVVRQKSHSNTSQ